MEEINENLIIKKEAFVTNTKGDITMFYDIEKKIGEGAYGKIYKVKNKQSGDIRAMKQIPKDKIPNLDKFKTEIKILSILDHPNIVRLFEVFEDDKSFYLLTELCTGGELLHKIQQKNLNEKEVAFIFNQLISAVAYCHSKGIVHRDLKPENILFATEEPDSPIKIIDFGFSVLFQKDDNNEESITQTSSPDKVNRTFKRMKTKVGTVLYVSPEIIKGSYDEKCDIWACGVILYILLCGYPPFSGGSDKEIYGNISSIKFDFPQKDWKNISKSAKDLIKNMLSPAKTRYSAKQVLGSKWLESKLKKKDNEEEYEMDYTRIEDYKTFNKLKQAVITFIASRLSSEESKAIRNIFSIVDENKTGFISYEDFRKFLISNCEEGVECNEEDDKEIREHFLSVDIDHNNQIDYTEFLAANLDKEIYLKEEKMREAFRAFDANDVGFITKGDIIRVLKLEDLPDKDKIASSLVEENDFNKDGNIDYNDFKKMMEKTVDKEKQI